MNRPAADARGRSAAAPSPGIGLEEYGETAARLVEAARLGKWFPDPLSVASYFRVLAATSPDVWAEARISAASGLPTIDTLLRLQADGEIADLFLKEHGSRRRTPSERLAAKAAYYHRIRRFDLKPLHRLGLCLRRIRPGGASAQYEAVLDRFDPSENVFCRYVLLLEQSSDTEGRALAQRVGDYSRQTAQFRDKMESVLRDESEIAFLILGKTPGVRVEEVSRARIGPLWSPLAPGPARWFDDADGAFVLHAAVDRAAESLRVDRDADPFSTLFRNSLSRPSRAIVEDAARELGYKIDKDRKFVCSTRSAARRVRERLAERGARNLVYCLENEM